MSHPSLSGHMWCGRMWHWCVVSQAGLSMIQFAYESPVPQRQSSFPIHLDRNLFMGLTSMITTVMSHLLGYHVTGSDWPLWF